MLARNRMAATAAVSHKNATIFAACTMVACLSFVSSAAAQTGACCGGGEGICMEGLTEAQCVDPFIGGFYLGDGTDCGGFQGLLNGCGACCDTTTGVCAVVTGHFTGGACDGPQEDFFVNQDCSKITCPGPGQVCGNNIQEGTEQCDGTDDAACPGLCQTDCTCPGEALPTTSEWGMVILMLSLLVGMGLKLGRHATPEPS